MRGQGQDALEAEVLGSRRRTFHIFDMPSATYKGYDLTNPREDYAPWSSGINVRRIVLTGSQAVGMIAVQSISYALYHDHNRQELVV